MSTSPATQPTSPESRTLSEADSKSLLASFGVRFAAERIVTSPDDAAAAADEIGFPAVVKLNGDAIAHKTERGLVRLRLPDADSVRAAGAELLSQARPEDGPVSLLVAPMLQGNRELIAGLAHDPQFGMTVMIGVGGVLAEAIADVAIRPVPVTATDASEMIDDLSTRSLLEAFRGEPAVDRQALIEVILALSAAAAADPRIVSVDLNPLIVVDGTPIAVDALVEVTDTPVVSGPVEAPVTGPSDDGFRALFDPSGVVVAGASTHPGKFGFVTLHNLLAAGFTGKVQATNRDRATVLGIETVADIADMDDGSAELLVCCTPAGANPAIIEAAASKGVKAVFVTSAGYGEADEDGRRAQEDLVTQARSLGLLLAGPNGQGVVSTPSRLCAQIVAPYPPAGHIGVASQSGNFVSSFQNYAVQTGVGISRAVSAGNAAATTVADYLAFYGSDPVTRVGLAYVEGVGDGRAFLDAMRSVTEHKPLVLVKGGTTAVGQRAAASHTGSLATDDRVFAGAARQAGITRAATVEEAFEAAATFATQPLPRGPRVVILTTVGGWGVVAADALSGTDLELLALPEDLLAEIDTKLPPRWSRNNPVDMAGGETRDTIPEVLDLVARHDAVDAVIMLGLGIQSNQARLMRQGPFYPEHGLERIVEFHERQDARYATAAADVSDATAKPVLVATELAVTDPTNAGPVAVRATGRLCYPSANRAVTALAHAWTYSRWRQARGLPVR
ncbi:MAG: acetate--CoA ligase family protein [Acidimicrobiales bacterium]|jgi:acyl-CoA synthetase (NDP forming)